MQLFLLHPNQPTHNFNTIQKTNKSFISIHPQKMQIALTAQIQRLSKANADKNIQIDQLKRKLVDLQSHICQLSQQRSYQDFNKVKSEDVERKMKNYQEKIEDLETGIVHQQQENQKLRNQMNGIEKQLAKKKQEIDKYENFVQDLTKRQEDYEAKIKMMASQIDRLENIKRESKVDDSVLQRPVIGSYPFDIHHIHEANDGGACVYETKFVKTSYLNGNGKDVGYYVPGGHYLSFKSFSGGHQLWLGNFEFKKGLIYTISFWLRTNSNKNPWNKGEGSIASDKAMFNVVCRGYAHGMLEVGPQLMNLMVVNHTPELKKYVSEPYQCKEDKLVSIILHPWLYQRNGYLWDIAYPEIQWRI